MISGMINNGRLLFLKQASEKFGCSESSIKRMLRTSRVQDHKIKYCQETKNYFLKMKVGQILTLARFNLVNNLILKK